ncbi:probable cysteine--tRNA ligase, mitochondrial [Zerene cesonia]|uniref:probable cysteine--tRNA ligase, mitochondrial n=1 Tax=Zerene cesonia TaxID=33412 RepID=UPI0018E57CE0|nr:probable cysteine--tRNA ligase, mitochondrial [Zerene cesonia]
MKKIFPVLKRNLSHVCNLKPYKETKWLMPNGNPTGVYVYNCVAEERVPVILNDPTMATWYSCGPTVYDSAHIGHACCYVKLDIIQRILKSFFNIKLVTAMGMTDIDDKIIKKAKETKTAYKAVSKQFEHEFWIDMANLNIEKPMIVTRVSDHMNTIENFIKNLIDSNMAYMAKDGSVYFDTTKFHLYGKLQSTQDHGEPSDEFKKNNMDFALWKAYKPGEPSWQTQWGDGRPGWHIECSAMVSKIFGSQLDFHAGGIDLKFPHHENEEAQSCAFHSTRQWANYWIHIGHLNLKDTKMSKSLQNTISIPNLLETYSADTFRMACLLSNYRHPMEYSDQMMKMAQEVVNKFKFFLKDVSVYVNNSHEGSASYNYKLLNSLQLTEEKNLEALKSDFDTPTCINSMLSLMSNANTIMKIDTANFYPVPMILIADYILDMLTKFGLQMKESTEHNISNSLIDTLVEFRHTVRENALKAKDKELLTSCDIVRDKMKSVKIQINDSKTPSWIYVK